MLPEFMEPEKLCVKEVIGNFNGFDFDFFYLFPFITEVLVAVRVKFSWFRSAPTPVNVCCEKKLNFTRTSAHVRYRNEEFCIFPKF